MIVEEEEKKDREILLFSMLDPPSFITSELLLIPFLVHLSITHPYSAILRLYLYLLEEEKHQLGPHTARDVWKELKKKPRVWEEYVRLPHNKVKAIVCQVAAKVSEPREVYQRKRNATKKRKRCKLTTKNRVLMVLLWMWHYEVGISISMLFGVSISILSEEIRHILPILWVEFREEITWPDVISRGLLHGTMPHFSTAIGSVDNTHTKIGRPHRWQSLYYRGDKKFHSLISLLIIDPWGIPLYLSSGWAGGMADGEVFSESGIEEYLDINDWLLADGGYPERWPFITPFPREGTKRNNYISFSFWTLLLLRNCESREFPPPHPMKS